MSLCQPCQTGLGLNDALTLMLENLTVLLAVAKLHFTGLAHAFRTAALPFFLADALSLSLSLCYATSRERIDKMQYRRQTLGCEI